jgi:hypothetical protein
MRRFVVPLVLLVTCSLPVAAQPRHPIYLQYDGFVRNPDDSLTLAFGYYNLNQVDVSIAPGADNRFLVGAGDRDQPVLFLAGRHRFACVMVVPEDFDGGLQWQVSFTGHTSTTTARMMDTRYALEEASAVVVLEKAQGLVASDAPAGVCLDADEARQNDPGPDQDR